MFSALDLDPAALDRPARTYSKGMTQKLGIAACLLSGKALYVLDEPAGGLDPKARALLKSELRALRERGQHRVLHLPRARRRRRAVRPDGVLHAGRLRFAGTPAELNRRHGSADLESAFLGCIAAPGESARPGPQ